MRHETDVRFMMRAMKLAELGRGHTSPNPVVGAVAVRDGEVVGEGLHERYGSAHAEVNALAMAGDRAEGTTLYVTLEPCCVSGNTPPCTDAILAARVARVVTPMEDPNPDVAGRGIAILRDAGVAVDLGVLREDALEQNAAYVKYRATGLPLVTLKLAMSLDGRIAAPPGGLRWTSSPHSREAVHAMRATSDCVMVGVGTVLADDPLLTDRRGGDAERQPARLVLDTRLRTPLDSKLVESAGKVRTVLACGIDASERRIAELTDRDVAVWPTQAGPDGLDLMSVLSRAASEGLTAVLAEGGAAVATSLLRAGAVDRVAFFLAPRLYGAGGTRALSALDPAWWDGRDRFTGVRWSEVGGDCLFEASVVPAKSGDGGS